MTDSLNAGLVRLLFDLLVTTVIVVGVYYRLYRQRDFVFTYLLLNLITFALARLLSGVPIEMGFALGLFGVFGILRYRAEAIRVRDLTYLFVVIGIALINALAGNRIRAAEIVVVNLAIVAMIFTLEAATFSEREESRMVVYDRLELLGPSRSADLLADLRSRTHLPIERVEIGDVDLLRDSAQITVFYAATPRRSRS